MISPQLHMALAHTRADDLRRAAARTLMQRQRGLGCLLPLNRA